MASQLDIPEDAPRPRLAHVTKWDHFDGYGFNLHSEKQRPGQFIGKVDPGSPAEKAGLREGDRIIEVNGDNISHENHKQVVARIRAVPEQTKLLVVDSAAENYYREADIVITGDMPNILYGSSLMPAKKAHEEEEDEIIEEQEEEEELEEEPEEQKRPRQPPPAALIEEQQSRPQELIEDREPRKEVPPPNYEEVENEPNRPNVMIPLIEIEKEDSVDSGNERDEDSDHEIEVEVTLDRDEDEENAEAEVTPEKEDKELTEIDGVKHRSSAFGGSTGSDSSPRSTPSPEPASPPPSQNPVIAAVSLNNNKSSSVAKTNSAGIDQMDWGGLNLNMTAKEMRQRIGSKKKNDPRKGERMDFRRKHEIIEKM